MKPNTVYSTYEILVLLVIALTWGQVLWGRHKFTEDFVALTSTQKQAFKQAQLATQQRIKQLQEGVKKQGNTREGLERIKRAQLLLSRTNQVVNFLEAIKTPLQKMSPKQANDWMIEQKKAYQVKAVLDKYMAWYTKEYKDLALPEFEANLLYSASEADEYFAQHHFKNASLAEIGAALSQKQLAIKRYEAEVLHKLGADDLHHDLHADAAGGIFVHQPFQQIQVGDDLMAEMVIKNFYGVSKANPRFFMNNTPIPVSESQGKVTFVTHGAGQKHWQAKFILRAYGRDSIIIHQIPFEVLSQK